VAFFAWQHAFFCVAKAKQARGTGYCHAWKKRFPRHDIATRGVFQAIATRGVLAIATRGVL